MFIKKIELENFRNYDHLDIELNNDINIIYGDNAQGKTNILEAIYLSSFGRGFRSKQDKELLKFDKQTFNTKIIFNKNERDHRIELFYDGKLNKKFFKINGVAQTKVSSLLGKINMVMYKPDDIDLIKKGPTLRRAYIDILISSLRPNYIEHFANYNKILSERNKFLKDNRDLFFNDKSKLDLLHLSVLNKQLVEKAKVISEYRDDFIKRLSEKANIIHKKYIKSGKLEENLELKYITNCKDVEKSLRYLSDNISKDFSNGYTSFGVQRDDIEITINGLLCSMYCSQGQQKSSILSIKLAEIEIVESEVKTKPVLLLDDFMSELDEKRQKRFIENIKDYQIIITSTNKIEIEKRNNNIIKIHKGEIENVSTNKN